MSGKAKIIRVSTVPLSLNIFCRGLLAELSETYDVVAVTSPGKGFDEIARREGVRTIAVSMRRNISPFSDLVAIFRLVKVFRAERPQLVHSITPKAGLLSMMAARIAGVPVRVHTFTGLLFPTATGVRRRLLMLTDRITCACATHVHAEGRGVKDDLTGYGITRRPVRVLGHGNVRGIDLLHYDRSPEIKAQAADIRASLRIPASDVVFIFVGRFVTDKGINELVTAFCRLIQSHPQSHLLLVGCEEPHLSPLSGKIRQLMTVTHHIHVVDWQDDVRSWYAAADALVFPSHREGFPNVVIEAGAMGLPAIVTDISGSREIIRQGENGVILPVSDGNALHEAMTAFVEHPEIVDGMARRARPLVASRYEQGYVRRCLKDFYHDILQ